MTRRAINILDEKATRASAVPLEYRVGDRVIERYGDADSHQEHDTTIVSRDGHVVMTELGGEYDALTGMAARKGMVYMAIRFAAYRGTTQTPAVPNEQ